MSECCSICQEEFNEENPSVTVKEKGLRTLVRVCKDKELDDLCRFQIYIFLIEIQLVLQDF